MLTDFNKEIVDKVEEAIRLGFQIAKDYSDIDYVYDNYYDDDGRLERRYYIEFLDAERALEKKITEMKIAALGQEAA